MAKITVEEVYSGEKYNVMGEAMKDYLTNGKPECYSGQTWLEMLIVKHSLLAAEKMKKEDDLISGMTDKEPSSFIG